jgi:hypothetical protein
MVSGYVVQNNYSLQKGFIYEAFLFSLYDEVAKIMCWNICAMIFLVLGCNTDITITKAYIEERAVLNDSTLKICYCYQVQDKLFRDSIEVKNKIVVSNRLNVSFSKKIHKPTSFKYPEIGHFPFF